MKHKILLPSLIAKFSDRVRKISRIQIMICYSLGENVIVKSIEPGIPEQQASSTVPIKRVVQSFFLALC